MAEHKKGGLKSKATFAFFDEAGVSDKPFVTTTWGKRGKTPRISSAGGWKTRSLMGMILFSGHRKQTGNYVWIKRSSVKKEDILSMLSDIKKKHGGTDTPFILLWDGLAAHKANVVQEFIVANSSWLSVHRFPAYAPELNPQEYQWSSLKRKDLGNYCPETMDDLERKARNGIRRMKNDSELLKGFLKKSGLWGVKELGEEQ